MGRRHISTKRYLLLSTLALLAATAIAQTTTAANTDAETTKATTTAANTETDEETTAATETTKVPALTSAATTTTTKAATTTAAANTRTVPTLPTSAGAVTSFPAPSVPPTNDAPFMQKSSMPEGTVFIAVGAIMGAFGVAILIWRAVVACLLHRSVKRAALAQHMANDKMAIPGAPPAAPFYKYTDHESQGSLGAAAAAGGRGVRRTQRGPIPSATPSQTNLFFSPTAANTGNGGNRSSTFLPSGFYAAGQGAPQQGHDHAISLTNLRPESRGFARHSVHSPPESPGLTPRNDPRRHPHMSTSSLNLNQVPTGRAPSMYLEDLLDENPQQFPPPGHRQTWDPSNNRI
ncbi:hypothetical protein JX265_004183 [Neoarthrinium moseri]|uniref:Uncharacterized protein n=1 Tax=Neoarthrinium moseri TaxID=1658444 RepID=A0A9P9WRY2_9PEZI|nr:uncharacterized protein JN550_008629 [Neoarthrinium moseri]KAI1864809.1 hypothetical protein JN550_008629 [Neoarthrinium moseri]KAI1876657.1 hypothetical protein JX265_004183 [Neoarthrinium moseri]